MISKLYDICPPDITTYHDFIIHVYITNMYDKIMISCDIRGLLLQEYALWNGDFLSFKSTAHDIIECNPVLLVIVASHMRPRAMI